MEMKQLNLLKTKVLPAQSRIWMSPQDACLFDTNVSVRVGASALVGTAEPQASHAAIEVAAVGF